MMAKNPIIEKVNAMLPKGSHLLYLARFGSHLYGTATETSDCDYQGVFLPSIYDMALMKNVKSCQYSSGDQETKNTSEDLDIQVWSAQYWVLNLINKMDTVGLDLYFSHTNSDAVIYKDKNMDLLFTSPELLIDSEKVTDTAYISYAMAQARKYGIKGSKISMLLELDQYLSSLESTFSSAFLKEQRLSYLVTVLLDTFKDSPFLAAQKLQDGTDALEICGKSYPYYVKLSYFIKAVRGIIDRYGDRAKRAAENEGIDWKAVSHAVRACHQATQLAQTGIIKFPLSPQIRQELIDIKQGNKSWDYVSSRIENGIETVKKLQPEWYGKWTYGFAERFIWSLYDM
jgi:predicted nucleotidyltransferase